MVAAREAAANGPQSPIQPRPIDASIGARASAVADGEEKTDDDQITASHYNDQNGPPRKKWFMWGGSGCCLIS